MYKEMLDRIRSSVENGGSIAITIEDDYGNCAESFLSYSDIDVVDDGFTLINDSCTVFIKNQVFYYDDMDDYYYSAGVIIST